METIEEIREILKEIAIINKELKISQQEFKISQIELQNSQKETDLKFKETDRLIGGLGEKFGSFTEGLAYPSMRKILQKNYGIDNTVANYLKRFPNGTEIELDAFGFTNGSVNNAVVVEVKSHLKSEHIYKFIKLLENFKENFPDFANKHLYGIMATVRNVSKELKEELFNNGIELAIIHDNIFDLERNPNVKDWNE